MRILYCCNNNTSTFRVLSLSRVLVVGRLCVVCVSVVEVAEVGNIVVLDILVGLTVAEVTVLEVTVARFFWVDVAVVGETVVNIELALGLKSQYE